MSDAGSTSGKRKMPSSRSQRPTFIERSGSAGSIRSVNASGSLNPPLKQPFLVLLPLNDTFEPKCIQLPNLPDIVRIGRQTNKSTLPNRENGFFDSKVLSRSHAEVWADARGRVCIKDVRSSNGTFVNGMRLSKENEESEVRELYPGDTLELGIDILNDETGTIVHRKVSARVDYAGAPQDSLTSNGHGSMSARDSGSDRVYGETRLASRNHNGISSSNDFAQASPAPVYENHHPLATFGKQSVTFEMVVKKLANDLQLSKRVSADLKSTSDTFSKAAAQRFSRRPPVASPFMPSPASTENASLSVQLARTKAALDAQSARVAELETMLAQERDLRIEAASQWQLPALTTQRLYDHDERDLDTMSDITMQADESHAITSQQAEDITSLTARLAESERQRVIQQDRAALAEEAHAQAQSQIEQLLGQVTELETSRTVLAQKLADVTRATATAPIDAQQGKRGGQAPMTLKNAGGTALMSALGVVVLGLSVMGLLNEYAVKET